ncbi:unnamed protein product [Cunninghamella blakesleeana]
MYLAKWNKNTGDYLHSGYTGDSYSIKRRKAIEKKKEEKTLTESAKESKSTLDYVVTKNHHSIIQKEDEQGDNEFNEILDNLYCIIEDYSPGSYQLADGFGKMDISKEAAAFI